MLIYSFFDFFLLFFFLKAFLDFLEDFELSLLITLPAFTILILELVSLFTDLALVTFSAPLPFGESNLFAAPLPSQPGTRRGSEHHPVNTDAMTNGFLGADEKSGFSHAADAPLMVCSEWCNYDSDNACNHYLGLFPGLQAAIFS